MSPTFFLLLSSLCVGLPGGPDGKESAMQKTQVRFPGQEDPLEKEIATHSSVLAWRIPWTDRHGWPRSIELQSQTWLKQLGTQTHTHSPVFGYYGGVLGHEVMSDSRDPMGCSPPGFCVHGILQARILEWVAISFSRGSSWPRNQTQVSCIADGLFTNWIIREPYIWVIWDGVFVSLRKSRKLWLN